MKKRRAYPLPEALVPGRWKVHHTDRVATTSVAKRHMDVALDAADPKAQWSRLHEMAHVAFSPAVVPPGPFILAAEDARVNLRLAADGAFDVSIGDTAKALKLLPMAVRTDPGLAALAAVSLAGTSAADQALACLTPELRAPVEHAVALVREDLTDFESAQRAAAYLREHVPAPLNPIEGCQHGVPCKETATAAGGGSGDDAVQVSEPGRVMADLFGDEMEGGTPALFASSRGQWGPMTIETPALRARLPRAVGRGKWRPSDTGAFPRRMERWAVDLGVFAQRGRQRGGTVLIDASGSMHLDPQDILHCVTAAPAATVAMYTCASPCHGHAVGALTILAQRGRRVTAVRKDCGGNVVDGPALRWLGTQRSPRLWVSDGKVTGRYDQSFYGAYKECADVCKAFAIRRVRHVEDAVNVLKRGGRA